jgi:hypothetical protein
LAAQQIQENRHQQPSPPVLNRAFQEHFQSAKLNIRLLLTIKQVFLEKLRLSRADAE